MSDQDELLQPDFQVISGPHATGTAAAPSEQA
jgi:hypothetical protein